MTRTDSKLAKDPAVKEAATRLFWASDDFRRAYTEWMFARDQESGAKLEALAAAERQIDDAKRALSDVQGRLAGRRMFELPEK